MPYYSELGLTGLPSSSAYSTLFSTGPYANHSSIIASNLASSNPFSRQYRAGYKPHLSTITELRRINSPKIYHSLPRVNLRPIKKINTADIDVSVNRYKKFEKYEKPKTEAIEKKPSNGPQSPKRSPRASVEDKEPSEAKPNPNIRRDRATIRLHTVHKDTLQQEIGAVRSWRDNFKPEELDLRLEDGSTGAKRMKKSPGEILKEKFLIRSRSKENMLKAEPRRMSMKKHIRKSPSFHDICEAITSDEMPQLNPGQPEAVQRRQSRQISGEKMLKEIKRTSSELSQDDMQILDAILSEQQEKDLESIGPFESRGSVRKKRLVRNKSNENVILGDAVKKANRISKSLSKEKIDANENKSTLERRPAKKRLTVPLDDAELPQKEKKDEDLINEIHKNVIRDISQVEIEQTVFKPKPIISGSGDIEDTKPSLKAVVDDVQVKEESTPKKGKKFRFNVIVEVDEEPTKITAEKLYLRDHRTEIQLPKGKVPVLTSILKKRHETQYGQIMEPSEKIIKTEKEPKDDEITANLEPANKLSEIEKFEGTKEDVSNTSVDDEKRPNVTNVKKTQIQFSKLQQDLSSSSNSKENSPTPASPTAKERNFVNKILSKKGNSSLSSFFDKTPVSSQRSSLDKEFKTSSFTPVQESDCKSNSRPNSPLLRLSNKSKLLEHEIKSPPHSPITKLEESTKKSDSRPGSPAIKSQNLYTKFTTPPGSPVIKKVNSFDEIISDNKTPTSVVKKFDNKFAIPQNDFRKDTTPPTSQIIEQGNSLDTSVSNINKTPNAIVNKLVKKVETPPPSPKDKIQNFFARQEINHVQQKITEPQKDEISEIINTEKTADETSEENSTKSAVEKKLVSKRSLVAKANKDDPDLAIFIPPEPEPEPDPEPEEKKDVFVPLQSNRLSQFMHPLKKPEQFDVCPVEIWARPKVIRGRHYPRPRGHPAPPPPKSEESESSEEDETDDETSSEEEETTSEEETESEEEGAIENKGASTSSNDSGFGSGALGNNKDCDVNIHKKCEKLTANLCGVNQKLVVEAIESVRKGSLESRDSPTSNHANNPAFALDSADIPEEYSQSSTFTGFQKSGRITPPATTIPRFRKYCLDDFNFLKVLGKGSFGKVLLAELKDTEYYYAVKCLKKDVVLEDDDVECTLIERKVLALGTKHPYLCHLLCTFQTESHLFFVMEYLNGGDLVFHIQAMGRFPEHQARFYGAEIVSGLKFLHNKGIVYRDLKLDNVLLDFDGHVRIADFGMCKLQIFLDRMAETFCGTPDYMAPEIIKGQHYNQGVDWWSFGVLLYEMLLGQSPFSGCDEDELFWSICNEKPVLPRYLSAEATNVLSAFLEKDSSKRLGSRFGPHGDIQDQAFFKPIDWNALEARQLEPPFKPHLQHPLDTQYFDKHFTVEKAKLTPIDPAILQSMDQTQFQGFSYTNPNATDK